MITDHAGVLYFGYVCIGFNKTALVLRLTHLNWQSPWWNKFHLFHIYFMLIGWSRANIFMWDVNYNDKLRQRTLCSAQMTPWWLLDNLFRYQMGPFLGIRGKDIGIWQADILSQCLHPAQTLRNGTHTCVSENKTRFVTGPVGNSVFPKR